MAYTKIERSVSSTPPKGRPTPPRTDTRPIKADTVTLQWTALGLAVAGIIGGLIYFGGDWGGGSVTHGVDGHGAQVVVVDAQLVGRPGQVG